MSSVIIIPLFNCAFRHVSSSINPHSRNELITFCTQIFPLPPPPVRNRSSRPHVATITVLVYAHFIVRPLTTRVGLIVTLAAIQSENRNDATIRSVVQRRPSSIFWSFISRLNWTLSREPNLASDHTRFRWWDLLADRQVAKDVVTGSLVQRPPCPSVSHSVYLFHFLLQVPVRRE